MSFGDRWLAYFQGDTMLGSFPNRLFLLLTLLLAGVNNCIARETSAWTANMDDVSRTPDDKALTRREDQSIASPSYRPGTQRALTPVHSIDPASEYESFREDLTEFAGPPKAKGPKVRVAQPTTVPEAASTIVRLGAAALILAFALGGFFILPLYVAILWLVFLIVAFPIGLAYMSQSHVLERNDLLTLYTTGVQQLPIIGRLLSGVLPGVKKND